jgi:ribosome biogenesis GTPase
MSTTFTATICADYGKQAIVQLHTPHNHNDPDSETRLLDRTLYTAKPRKIGLRTVVGDTVMIERDNTDKNTLWITQVISRNNALYRADATKQKCFAANIDTVFLVLAPEPAPLLDLLARTMVACYSAGLSLHIVLNKSDLPQFTRLNTVQTMLDVADIPYTVLNTQIKHHNDNNDNKDNIAHSIEALYPYLLHKRSLILGQSGVGKSSLINVLIPNTQAQIQALSNHTLTGRHTTTSSYLYQGVYNNTAFEIIDSPGFQNFGLTHIEKEHWIKAFNTLTPYHSGCRFYNCTHLHEPSCAVIQSLKDKTLAYSEWYQLFKALHEGPRA